MLHLCEDETYHDSILAPSAMKRVSILSLFSLSLIFSSCFIIDPCWGGPDAEKFRTLDFDSAIRKVMIDTAADELTPRLFAIENDTLVEGELGIWMVPVKDFYFVEQQKRPAISFISSAYACSLPEPTSDEVITNIQIRANKAFDANHPAGSDIADLFSIIVLDVPNGNRYFEFSLPDFLSTRRNAVDEIILVLNAQPEQTEAFNFTVTYVQEGEHLTTYEYTTQDVFLFGL